MLAGMAGGLVVPSFRLGACPFVSAGWPVGAF